MDPKRFLEAMKASRELDVRMSNAWTWCEENECFPVAERIISSDADATWTVCGRFWSETPLLAAEEAMRDDSRLIVRADQ